MAYKDPSTISQGRKRSLGPTMGIKSFPSHIASASAADTPQTPTERYRKYNEFLVHRRYSSEFDTMRYTDATIIECHKNPPILENALNIMTIGP
jgi:hypothetical protein